MSEPSSEPGKPARRPAKARLGPKRGGPTRGKLARAKSTGGRPAYAPTDDERDTVEGMVLAGIPQDRIAEILRIDEKTLRKHFRDFLDSGIDKTSGRVVRNLVKLSETHVAASAMFLYNRQPKYWQDRRRLDVRIEDPRPDLSHLDEEQLAQLRVAAALLEAPVIEGEAVEIDGAEAEGAEVPAAK